MKNEYQQYYTKSHDLTSYMVDQLDAPYDAYVMEPSAGDGALVDAVIDKCPSVRLDIYEKDEALVAILKTKYSGLASVNVICTDTLLDDRTVPSLNNANRYDRIIANPPYGAWQENERRNVLHKVYPDMYVKETYGIFLFQAIHLLKDGGRLVFIIPSTFLYLHRHTFLRRTILQRTKVVEVAIFPSNFFPGVHFGYASLCIITLEKCISLNDCMDNVIIIRRNLSSSTDLLQHGNKKTSVKQKNVYESMDSAFLLSDDMSITRLLANAPIRLGDIANCVTGFYSGDDRHFVRVLNKHKKNCSKFESIDIALVSSDFDINGIAGDVHYVPIVRGGGETYIKKVNCFVDWSISAVSHYKTDKKARLQNSSYYFKRGIGVPMVKSSRLTASVIDNALFDQGIVGIFPKDNTLVYYLLGYLNSSFVSDMMMAINPSANNSANYLKKLPVIMPDADTVAYIDSMVRNVIEMKKADIDTSSQENSLNSTFEALRKDKTITNCDRRSTLCSGKQELFPF